MARWLVAVALLAWASVPAAADDFATFLAGVRRDAIAAGIAPPTVDRALAGLAPLPRVLELDRKQPEFTLTVQAYLDRIVTSQRVAAGRDQLRQAADLMTAIGQRYRVEPRFVVALWGIESDFGRFTGDFSVVQALATLAFDGRRSSYFRGELLDALRVLDRGVPPTRLRGSWAGAMGQPQFMPSSYLRYAVAFRGGASPDIWTDPADVVASIANYLGRLGWRSGEGWGAEVALTQPLAPAAIGLDQPARPLAEWARLGVRRTDGAPLGPGDLPAKLVMVSDPPNSDHSGGDPAAAATPAQHVYLATANFEVLLKWNRSNLFAVAVGILADRLGAP